MSVSNEELRVLQSWGSAILKMADVAVSIGDLQDAHARELAKLESAKKVADQAQAAAEDAKGNLQSVVVDLNKQAEAAHAPVARRLSEELARLQNEVSVLTAARAEQKENYQGAKAKYDAEIGALKQQKAELETSVRALKDYLEKARAAVHSV